MESKRPVLARKRTAALASDEDMATDDDTAQTVRFSGFSKMRADSSTSDMIPFSSSSFMHSFDRQPGTSSPFLQPVRDFDFENSQIDAIPSSPPIISQSQATLVDSPPKLSFARSTSSLTTEPNRKRQRVFEDTEELALDRDGRVFGVLLPDATFPEGYRPSLYDDPTFFVVRNPDPSSKAAAEIITKLFDQDIDYTSRVYTLELEELGLNSLPRQISDFKDLVLYGPTGIIKPILHIHAAKNQLRSLTPKIFDIEGLEVLSLRGNKIARVPGLIERSTNLKSLNLSNNKLKFLPPNILKLNSLQTLRVRPNPLIEWNTSDNVRSVNGNSMEKDGPVLKYLGQLHWISKNKQVSKAALNAIKLARNLSTLQDTDLSSMNSEQSHLMGKYQWTPTLTELALRKISDYLISQAELLKWKETVHERVYRLAIKALIHGNNGETCGYCNHTCIESVAELMEWWDFKDAIEIPIKRKFCYSDCIVGGNAGQVAPDAVIKKLAVGQFIFEMNVFCYHRWSKLDGIDEVLVALELRNKVQLLLSSQRSQVPYFDEFVIGTGCKVWWTQKPYFHHTISPSADTVLVANGVVYLVTYANQGIQVFVCFHRLTDWSLEQLRMYCPVAFTSTLLTQSEWPLMVSRHHPDRTSHFFTVLSREQLNNCVSSAGLNRRPEIKWSCPVNTRITCPVRQSQSFISRSEEHEAKSTILVDSSVISELWNTRELIVRVCAFRITFSGSDRSNKFHKAIVPSCDPVAISGS
ncbi:hypothetical protein OGAPHI_001921 [Ogataea philodendri]|uniref:Uncharacterized protein n=1 Tax=Ogataea philodendri TaxID=1378263 RepID=A0A9P8PA96_9ASCO|nr:uncharacterized protein OGAPHI_001921 [Ogataea philodendri]KAH3668167.1 hypothetical protein OGAPHI_001921 [Ogataea philodendri]